MMTEPTDVKEEREEDATRVIPSATFARGTASLSQEPSPRTGAESSVPPATTPISAAPANPTPASLARATPSGPHANMAPGQVLGHTYEIEAHLARGGMGEVYRARHIELGSIHAIKVILPELAEEPRIISLFQEEARKLRRVRNDAVVAYEGLFRDENGVRYLVMEFVDGPSLSRVIRQGPLSVEAVRQLRDRCAMGLAAAHEKGIFHRDISPDNIILVENRTDLAKIIDFGIAKSSDPGDKTVVGQDFAGKYSYVSPEQLGLYSGTVDGRSDIYSLGLVLVAAAAGRALDMGNSPASVIEARRAVPDLSSVPEELRAELAPLLEPNPADRPQNMRHLPGSSFAIETTSWSTDVAGGAADPVHSPAARPTAASQPSARAAPPKSISEPQKAAGGRKSVGIAAAIAAFLVVVGGGAFFLFQGEPASGPIASNQPSPPQPGPTAVPTEPAPLPAVSAPPPVSLAALQTTLDDLPCASVKATLTDGGGVEMAGFVESDADLHRLDQIAQSARAVSASTAPVKVYKQPLCEIAKLFEANPRLAAAPQPTIAFDNASKLYHDGAQLAVTATAPASNGGFLYVEYFATDGTVVHMLPTPRVTHNQIAPGGSMTLGTLGQVDKPNQDRFGIGPPYGPTMIVTILTSKPLFDHIRPQQENAAEYLKELKRRLVLDGSSAASPLTGAGYAIFDVEP